MLSLIVECMVESGQYYGTSELIIRLTFRFQVPAGVD